MVIVLITLATVVVGSLCFPHHYRHYGLLFSKGAHGVFNVRTDFSACFALGGETGTEESASSVDLNKSLHPVWTGNRTHGSCSELTTVLQLNERIIPQDRVNWTEFRGEKKKRRVGGGGG